jgi:polysaccharide biosynthesis protein PslA
MSAFRPIAIHDLAFPAHASAVTPISHCGRTLALAWPQNRLPPRQAAIKRTTDILLAGAALLIAGLPMLTLGVLMKLIDGGPILFRQQRIGLDNRPFTVLKFRSMRPAPDAAGTCPQATRDDPRITRLGHILRRTSIDELPQLLNVLAGTMSLVGPRPHAPGTCAAGQPFETLTDRYADRHCVKPGLTGLAQVRGWRGETDTVEKLLRRVDSDLEYIATWSLGRDLLIIARTAIAVLRAQNAY